MGDFEIYIDGVCYAYWKKEQGIYYMQSEFEESPTRIPEEEYMNAKREYCKNI